MTADYHSFLGIFIIILAYPLMVYTSAMIFSCAFESYIHKNWILSDGKKFTKIAKALKLDTFSDPDVFNPEQPKWYKTIQLLMGVLIIPMAIIGFFFVIYYLLRLVFYETLINIYKKLIKPTAYWWMGKTLKTEEDEAD